MGLFSKLKQENLITEKSQETTQEKDIYGELGIIEPFTLLVDKQFNIFISELANDKSGMLNDVEKKAFDILWDAAGVDYDGYGNNIWNLKKGVFDIYNASGVKLSFEKKTAEVKDKYDSDEGRANFVYLSPAGNFVIHQNERNKKAFLVYVSEGTSERLLKALHSAEAEALGLKIDFAIQNTRIGIPRSVSDSSIAMERINDVQNDDELTEFKGKSR